MTDKRKELDAATRCLEPDGPLLSIGEGSRELGVQVGQVRLLIAAGILDATKDQYGRWQISRASINKRLASVRKEFQTSKPQPTDLANQPAA
jgi:hypothetical protein